MLGFQEIAEREVNDGPEFAAREKIPHRGLRPALGGVFPMLLAVGSDESADAVVQLTAALARGKGAIPTVVQALGADRDAEVTIAPFVGPMVEATLSPEFRDERRAAVQRRVRAGAGDVQWRIEIESGSPAYAIRELARQLQPALIVMGLRQHGVVHRAVSGDLLRSVIRATRLPVLAVGPRLFGLPRRIVVAVDFGAASIDAARMARQLLAEDGEIHLRHVATDHRNDPAIPQMPHGCTDPARARLDHLAEDLLPAPGMTITTEVVGGEPVQSIEGCAARLDADLVAVRSDHHSPLDRLLSGSVSMALAHTARWSMLIVPGMPGPQAR